jgi:Flp pilus assembly protein TadG
MAMVELVLVLPVLLVVLFGLLEFGLLFGRWLTLSNAAREGAREAVLFRIGCDAGSVEAAVRERVRTYAEHLGVTLGDADIEVEGQCLPRNTTARVTVNLVHTFRVLPGLAEGVGPTIALVASSEMRNEGSG